jgi:hypothetical protein
MTQASETSFTCLPSRPASVSALKVPLTCLALLLFAHLAFADHVHHLWYNNSIWQDQDLTVLTGGGISYGAGIAAFYTPGSQLHVYYSDTNNHMHQLYYNNTSWSDADLTALTGGPGVLVGAISGFNIENFQYVFYLGVDQHVHELSYVDNWTDQDITVLGNGVLGNPVIVAFPTKPNNQFHVYYQDSNAHDMHQLYFNGTSWSDSDLTTLTGAYCPGGQWWAGLATGNLQHVLCAGYGPQDPNSLDLLHIYYNNHAWTYEDITLQDGYGLAVYPDSGVAAFRVGFQGEVYGPTTDGHMQDYTRFSNGEWGDADLTADIGAPTKTYGGIAAFITTPNNQYHIFYAPDNDIYQLYNNGTSWAVDNLTGGAGQADYYADITGFAIGNLQHVFYFDTNN